ncbi:MAG: hypothetical protein WC520_01845 [Candidatus Paceibacterota bacterium]
MLGTEDVEAQRSREERNVIEYGDDVIAGKTTFQQAVEGIANAISYHNRGPATRSQVFEAEARLKEYLRDRGFDPEAKKKKEGRIFAREQVAKIVAMGFPSGRAVAIMRAAGPGTAVEAAEWAIKAYRAVPSADAFDVVLGNITGTNGFGKDRAIAVLAALGFPVPAYESASSRRVFAILAGARVAIGNGLPSAMLTSER